jgi:kynurenine formamidase
MSFEEPTLNARSRRVDLGHSLDGGTIVWPGAGEGFSLCLSTHGASPAGGPNDFYAAGSFSCAEHAGTHVDAPFHFYQHGATVDRLALSELVAPARVLRTAQADVTVETIAGHEAEHGALPRGCIVLCDTGWGQKYAAGASTYLGFNEADARGARDAASLSLAFPGIAPDAAVLFVQRGVAAVGLDTASLDPGACKAFTAHRVLLAAGIFGIENLCANVSTLPPKGATVVVAPLKLAGGSGAPARVFAFVPAPASEEPGTK